MSYQQYIDSKVNWIGLVPGDWQRTRIKFGIRRSAAGVWGNDEKGNSDDVICFRIADFDYPHGELKLDNITLRNIEKKQLEGRLLSYGDLLIEKSGGGDATPVGRVVRVNYEGKATCSNFIHSLTLNEKLDNNFMYYYFHFLYSNKVNLLFFNQTTGLQNLKVSDYLSQSIYVPTIDEQKAIANYLDIQCAKIDKVIAAQEKRVELLQELKQSIITRAVTRGINPDVKLKDSVAKWIGQIPEHWEILKVKYIASLYGRIGFRGYNQSDIVPEGEGAITLSPSNMQEKMNYNSCTYLSWHKYYESPEIMIKDGDILFVKTGSTYGKSVLVDNLPLEATINPQIVVFKDFKCNNKFLSYVLKTPYIRAQVDNTVIGSTIPTISQEKIKNYCIALPPLSEQCEICEYIEKKAIKIDSSLSIVLHQIDLLKEYKQSLITEVVTGKRKVS